jgi:hypothetical protein
MLNGCEEIRAHCRRQWEMIAAQRELLRDLDERHTYAHGGSLRPEGAGRGLEEDISAGE